MSTERSALLAAIAAAPVDDLPRLVFADWLEEHGEPEWAYAIRTMCQLPYEFDAEVLIQREGFSGSPPLTRSEVRPVESWFETHAPHLLSMMLGGRRCGPVKGDWVWRQQCPSLDMVVEWRRGFIAVVRAPKAILTEHLPALLRVHPVEFVDATDVVASTIYHPTRRDGDATRLPDLWTYALSEGDWPHPGAHARCYLPRALFRHLRDEVYRVEETEGQGAGVAYDSSSAAKAALSTAFLAEAKGGDIG